MYPAAMANVKGVVMVSAVFSVCTISTMLAIVIFSQRGTNFLLMKIFEKYMHVLAGATIYISGLTIVLFGV
jgi:hypothetical protein